MALVVVQAGFSSVKFVGVERGRLLVWLRINIVDVHLTKIRENQRIVLTTLMNQMINYDFSVRHSDLFEEPRVLHAEIHDEEAHVTLLREALHEHAVRRTLKG